MRRYQLRRSSDYLRNTKADKSRLIFKKILKAFRSEGRSVTMISLFLTTTLLCFSHPAIGTFTGDFSEEDLERIGSTCSLRDEFPTCDTDVLCYQKGSCCLGSVHKGAIASRHPTQTCRRVAVSGGGFYMIDTCTHDSRFKRLCEDERNAESDIMQFVPVTSVVSSITYKNYFCFRCYENTDDFYFWNFEIGANDASDLGEDELVYNYKEKTWMIYSPVTDTWMYIFWRAEIPEDISRLANPCDPFVISNCSERWPDGEVKEKCHAYINRVYVNKMGSGTTYKNIHCLICNFEDWTEASCLPSEFRPAIEEVAIEKFRPFDQVYLLNISSVGEEMSPQVVQYSRCGKNQKRISTTKGSICVRKGCAIKSYVLKDGQCVPK